MIVTHPQYELREWLCARIGAAPEALPMWCFGRVEGRRLLGVVGLANFTDASCEMHCAGEGNWVSREFIRTAFGYAFKHVRVVLGLVGSGNLRALRFNRHLGFREECRIEGAHADGALVVMSLRREQCRHLEIKHGTQREAAAAA